MGYSVQRGMHATTRSPGAFPRVQRVTHLYRDASNYKFWGEFHVAGELSLDELEPHLLHGQYFVPEKIGLPSLVPEVQNSDDHLLHEFSHVEAVPMTPYWITSGELTARVRFANAQGWFSGTF